MTLKSILEYDKKSLERLKRFQLPNYSKKIGGLIALICFISMFVNAFYFDNEALRAISKFGILLGFLVVSISKEKIEDEFIIQLRMQSYTFAFIAAVLMAFIQPFINYAVDFAINGEQVFKENGDFVILWMLLFVQVFYFEMLKRTQG
ncbi:MAG: hypothetical protein ACPGXZ_05280 [Saprospiraceae bacterium]